MPNRDGFRLLAFLMLFVVVTLLTPAVQAATSFAGTWKTSWTTTDKRTAAAPVSLKADSKNANGIDGSVEVDGANGTLYGTVSTDGKTLTGNWWNPDGTKGTFTFKLTDSTHFTGTYTQAGVSGSFSWNGAK